MFPGSICNLQIGSASLFLRLLLTFNCTDILRAEAAGLMIKRGYSHINHRKPEHTFHLPPSPAFRPQFKVPYEYPADDNGPVV